METEDVATWRPPADWLRVSTSSTWDQCGEGPSLRALLLSNDKQLAMCRSFATIARGQACLPACSLFGADKAPNLRHLSQHPP